MKSVAVCVTLCATLLAARFVSAGTLSCSITPVGSCSTPNVKILRLSGATNAHAELPGLWTYTYNDNVVCCGGVTNLGTACSGTYAPILRLSASTNAHAELYNFPSYSYLTVPCLSVPDGGSVSVGYQQGSCTGYDTTLMSMATSSNSHVGNGSAYPTKVCASAANAGVFSVDIVDGSGNPVSNPSVAMGAAAMAFGTQVTRGTLGAVAQSIRMTNTTSNIRWSLSIAAKDGNTTKWSASGAEYDFNDPTANGADGPDRDYIGGQMSLDPSVGSISPKSGCTTMGLSLGSPASFSEGVNDSITLLSANIAASTNCYWDLTGVSVSQVIPTGIPTGNYSLDMTITATAI
jgi:hypothetical protein